jgi:hypothetical protein
MLHIDDIIKRFLRNDLQITPTIKAHSVLSKSLKAVMSDEANFAGILAIEGSAKNAGRNIAYLIKTKMNTAEYKAIVGHNEPISPKEFIIKCYDFVVENYL